MKRKRIFFTIILLLLQFCGSILWARPTTEYEAEMVVTGWLRTDQQPLGASLGQQVKKVETFTDDFAEPIYYIVYLQPAGFVIVPADDLIEPIIGFADDGTYDPSTDNPLGALVTNDLNGRIAMVRDIQVLEATSAMESAMERALNSQAKWDQLTGFAEAPAGPVALVGGLPAISDVRVAPLVQSKWAQTTCCEDPCLACYNYYTPPYGPNDPNNYPCGCVATAMSQVMRYHEHPNDPCGIGVNPFKISVDGTSQWALTRGGDGSGGPYNWDLMTLVPDCNTDDPNRQAIGALCYDAGVSVKMSYWPLPTGSRASSSDVNSALINTFMYSNAIYGDNGGANIGPALNDMVNPNLDYDHPVILGLFPGSTDGHAVVCDGYGWQYISMIPHGFWTLYHHLNMGWAGVQDAWYNFSIPDMPPGFSIVDGCVYNIFVSGSGEIISGRVIDASGNPTSGLTVTAQRTAGGTYNAVTNVKGIYALARIPSASTYTISINEAGYDFTDKVVSTGTSGVGNPPNTSGNVWGVDFMPFEGAIFVDANASGKNDGSNWTDAYKYLQDALAAASSGDTILVAQGTYRPDANSSYPEGTGDRYATFQLINSVEIYGGFPAGGCNSWDDRDPNGCEAILSGDIGTAGNTLDNSYHIVTGSGTDATAVLDGFVITAGNAHGSHPADNGGGMYNYTGSPTLANCTFRENLGDYGAGMLNNMSSSPTLTNCTFSDNSAAQISGGMFNANQSSPTLTSCLFSGNSGTGGGMHNWVNSNPILTNCIFIGNSAAPVGGGMYNRDSSSPTLTNCTFIDNTSNYGGGMYNWNNCNPTLTNCLFTGNSIGYDGGGGMHNRANCNPTMTNCTFSGNSANTSGGGIYNRENSSPTLTNCILWGNSDSGGIDESAQIHTDSGTPVVTHSCIQDDDPDDGYIPFGGVANNNIDDIPLFIDPNGIDGIVGTEDDNLRLSPGSPCIDTGDNSVVLPNSLDIENHPRLIDGDCNGTVTVDIGAYEFAFIYFGDLDGDCDIDFYDFAILAAHWLVGVE